MPTVTIYDDGDELTIRSPYEAKDIIKSLGGTYWNSTHKAWMAPRWLRRELVATLSHHGYRVVVIDERQSQTEPRRNAATVSWAAAMFAAIPTRLVQPVYRALSKVLHPDSGGDLECMKALKPRLRRPGWLVTGTNGAHPYGMGLNAQHAALLAASAISPDVASERGYVTVDTKSGLKRRGFGVSQANVPALLIPLWNVRGEGGSYQARPDQPRSKDGHNLKYEVPGKQGNVLDVPPRVQPHIGNPARPLLITEGVRKADSAVSAGLDCVRDSAHATLRRQWAKRGVVGLRCPRCGGPILAGQPRDLDEVDRPYIEGGGGRSLPAHRRCNRQHGAWLAAVRESARRNQGLSQQVITRRRMETITVWPSLGIEVSADRSCTWVARAALDTDLRVIVELLDPIPGTALVVPQIVA